MSKAILIIDTPKCCADCPVCAWSEITGLYNCLNGTKEEKCVDDYLLDDRLKKPTWCPLKPMPQKKNSTVYQDEINHDIPIELLDRVLNLGFDICIDEILGGNE